MRNAEISRRGRRTPCEARLGAGVKLELAGAHASSQYAFERTQRECDPGEARAIGVARGTQREAAGIGQARDEGTARGFRPLTAQVAVI